MAMTLPLMHSFGAQSGAPGRTSPGGGLDPGSAPERGRTGRSPASRLLHVNVSSCSIQARGLADEGSALPRATLRQVPVDDFCASPEQHVATIAKPGERAAQVFQP